MGLVVVMVMEPGRSIYIFTQGLTRILTFTKPHLTPRSSSNSYTGKTVDLPFGGEVFQ